MTQIPSVWVHDPTGENRTHIDDSPNSNVTTQLVNPPPIAASSSDMSPQVEKALATYMYHTSDVHEKLILGVYVDNLQMIHSHDIDHEGTKVKRTCIHEGHSTRMRS